MSKIEKSAVPGAEKLVGLISKHQRKNTIILALVISVCLVITLYSLGFIDMLKAILSVGSSSETPVADDSNTIESSDIIAPASKSSQTGTTAKQI